jgi:eukaryotic-like serine/threonine-protein kinase
MIAPAHLSPRLEGTVLENAYRLVRLIGQGGMGAVYEATQLRLNKRVAIKLMSSSEISDMVSLMRFHQEAEITSKLGHPHLVNVVDFGTAETGQPYLVMEYLEGEDLDQRLQRTHQIPPETAARIVVQSASALGAAHAQQIVHRDLKPANIFLMQVPGEPEFVKVLDFGISKIKAANAKRLTNVRAVVGTPSYMSPEQATGRADDTDHRADQWALACIAWEMLCGHPPFVADDVTALFYQITRIDPPSLMREVPDLPRGVEEVLRRGLSRNHLDRFPSIREFARAFELTVLGYNSDLTPPPFRIAPPPEANGGRITPARVSANQAAAQLDSAPAMAPGAVPDLPLDSTPITQQVERRRRTAARLVVAGGLAVMLLAVIGFFRFRSPAAAGDGHSGLAPSSARPDVVALPSASAPSISPSQPPAASAESPAGGDAASPRASSEKNTRSKLGKEPGPRSHGTKTKAKAVYPQKKHRLFEEL